jgi:hypothetical protein
MALESTLRISSAIASCAAILLRSYPSISIHLTFVERSRGRLTIAQWSGIPNAIGSTGASKNTPPFLLSSYLTRVNIFLTVEVFLKALGFWRQNCSSLSLNHGCTTSSVKASSKISGPIRWRRRFASQFLFQCLLKSKLSSSVRSFVRFNTHPKQRV